MKRALILGAGGLGKAIHEAFLSGRIYRTAGFLDDEKRGMFCRRPVLGKISDVSRIAKTSKAAHVIVALGYQYLKERAGLFEKLKRDSSLHVVNAVHRSAKLAKDVTLGTGIFIGMHVTVNAGTAIDDNSVIWTGSVIEHDNRIGKHVFIATGVITAGYVTIEDDVFVGMGAVIAKATIGKNATVGAGSLVLNNVASSAYVKGSPAKVSSQKAERSYLPLQ